MDSRLGLVDGRRVSDLRDQDLPTVAFALVQLVRRRAKLEIYTSWGIRVATIRGIGVSCTVSANQWKLIHPILMDPPPGQTTGYSDPATEFAFPSLDRADRELYRGFLGALSGVFVERWPVPGDSNV